MRKGVLLANGQSRDGGVSARLFDKGVYGFAATPRDDDAAIGAVIAAARDNATNVTTRPRRRPITPAASAPGEGVFDHRSRKSAASPAERVAILARLDVAMRQKFSDLVNVDLALNANASEKALVTSEGGRTYSYVPRAVLVVKMAVEANDGLVELHDVIGGFGEIQDQRFDAESLLPWLDALYEELRLKAEGGQCEAGAHDVVLDSELAGILAHEAIGHTCEGDLVLAGSVAGDRLGEQVASEKITLGDYASRGPDGGGTIAIHVDDEGTLCRDVTIIENGILKGFLHSRQTAAELDA